MAALDVVVCLKSVPDPSRSAAITLDPRTMAAKKDHVPRVISPLDRHALEAALQIREQRGGTVHVVSMGSPGGVDNMREALALGADDVLFLTDPACAGADTLATARALVALIRHLGHFDLVLCGARSFYGSTGQVGPQLAELLGIAHVGNVTQIDLASDSLFRLSAQSDSGRIEIEAGLPLLLTVAKEVNRPRGIGLPGIVAAKSKPLRLVTAEQVGLPREHIGLAGSATRMIRIIPPPAGRRAQILAGSPPEAGATLVAELRKAGLLAMLDRAGGPELGHA